MRKVAVETGCPLLWEAPNLAVVRYLIKTFKPWYVFHTKLVLLAALCKYRQ
jgi:hypothetical protein